MSNPKVFGQGSLTLRDRLEGDLVLAQTESMGSSFLGIHSPRCSLKGCNPGAMKTAFGPHEQITQRDEETSPLAARRLLRGRFFTSVGPNKVHSTLQNLMPKPDQDGSGPREPARFPR